MQIVKDNACMIDAIAREATIKSRAKLNKANVKSVVFSSTHYNTRTGTYHGHAHLIYYYKGHTWHYDNSTGSTKVYAGRYVKDILKVVKRAYSYLAPHIIIQKVVPLNLITHFERYAKPLPKKYLNV